MVVYIVICQTDYELTYRFRGGGGERGGGGGGGGGRGGGGQSDS